MTRPDGAQCGPLPGWAPWDLAEVVGGEPLVVMEGVDLHGERYALVGWGLGARAGSVAEAVRLASGDGAAGQTVIAAPGASGHGAPALLDAVVGSLDWDGTAHFWRPASAVLFQLDQGLLWRRGQMPAVHGVEVHAAAGTAAREAAPSATDAGGAAEAAADPGAQPLGPRPVRLLWDRTRYCAAVREAQREMAAGGLTKVILSVPMEVDWEAPPLLLYRRLTSGAKAGLRFYLDGGDGRGALMGISPEPLVGLVGGQVRMRLLAGTRKQQPGAEAVLTASEKDRHEHSVAVEQARQDLLTVCRPESVAVPAFLEVERHPGLVHLASSLTGRLREDVGPQDLVRACFPASTVGGIPRDRAAAVIEALEPLPRGWYAGAVGLVLPGGDLDLWLTIRSLRYQGGVVRLRTGAGLVPDSDPVAEWQECLNKAAHTLAALGGEIRE